MNPSILNLIKTVNTHYSHVDELETLARVLEDAYPEESVVAKTTFNSRYNYRCLGHREYQHPENHIDTFFDGSGLDHPLVTADNDNEILPSIKTN